MAKEVLVLGAVGIEALDLYGADPVLAVQLLLLDGLPDTQDILVVILRGRCLDQEKGQECSKDKFGPHIGYL